MIITSSSSHERRENAEEYWELLQFARLAVRRGQLVARYGIFMQFTKFSRTGLIVSRLCLGTETFGKQTDEAESFRVFDKATDAGVNFIDTADVYPGGADLPEVGRSEEITGLWLKGKRSRFSLGTKAGGRMGSSPWDQGSSRKHLLDAIEASLRRLNTDFVDLYQLHMDERRAVRKRWPRRMLRRVARAVTSQASWRG